VGNRPAFQPPLEVVGPRSVRISLTDRCDMACVYCRPASHDSYLENRLEEAAFVTMVKGLIASGVRRFRITGGEPLLHRDIVRRVAILRELGAEDLALTTNAARLAPIAAELKAAGLQRLTISLDSLQPQRFERITRNHQFSKVMAGIEAACQVGFGEIKLNTVVLRSENFDEIQAITSFAWQRNITPRFIEVMRIGEGAKLPPEQLVSAREVQQVLADWLDFSTPAKVDPNRGPACYLRAKQDRNKRVGFISGTTDTYCEGCDRLRVLADGTVRACLARNEGVNASEMARGGDTQQVVQAISQAWAQKPDGTVFKGCTESSAAEVSMRAVGG
jgi:GTP 3',8-cyclase